MHTLHNIVVAPIVTEKSNLQKEENNTVAFRVSRTANKIEIKNAVEKMFKVKVLGVRSTITRGKKKRVGKNFGMTQNFKKAYVTLSKDSKISFFEGV